MWSLFGPTPCHRDQVLSWWQDWLNYCTEDPGWLSLMNLFLAPFPLSLISFSEFFICLPLYLSPYSAQSLCWMTSLVASPKFWPECRFLFAFILFSGGPMPLFAHTAALTAHFCEELPSYTSLSKFLSLYFHFFLTSSSLVSQPFQDLSGVFFPKSLSSICAQTYSALFTFDTGGVFPSFPVDSFIAPNKCLSNPALWVSLRTCVGGSGKERFSQAPLTREAVAAAVAPAVTYHLTTRNAAARCVAATHQSRLPHPSASRKTPESMTAMLKPRPSHPTSNRLVYVNSKMKEPAKRAAAFGLTSLAVLNCNPVECKHVLCVSRLASKNQNRW